MAKNSMGFLKGIGMGVAVGSIAGAIGYGYVQHNKKGIKRNVGKALHNVSELVDNVNSMF